MGGRSRGSASRLPVRRHTSALAKTDLLGRKRLRLDDLEQPDFRERAISPAEPAPGQLREPLAATVAGDAGVDGITFAFAPPN